MQIGEKIAKLRKERGLTQLELASQIGCSDKAVSKWESNMGLPDIVNLRALADLFGVTLDELVSKEDMDIVVNERKAETEISSIFDKMTLQKVTYDGDVVGNLGAFTVKQTFHNHHPWSVNVFYTFPVSATGTVYGFEAKVGEKVIVGIVKEKAQAQKQYQKALAKGDSAYLLENEDNNLFKVTVGRIPSNETVEITLKYIDKFDVHDNSYEIRIPTLLPPRYNDPISGNQKYVDEVDYTADFKINFDAATKLTEVRSATHPIKQEGNAITCKDARLNKDFVLQVILAKDMNSAGLSYQATDGQVYTLAQFMPQLIVPKMHTPQKYIFIVDQSGSMRGAKNDKTKIALRKCLGQLQPGDQFDLIKFGSDWEVMSQAVVGRLGMFEYLEEDLKQAIVYINEFNADMGGTEIAMPIGMGLSNYGENTTVILITDGEVGNERKIANAVSQFIGTNRLFILGIDTSVNVSGLNAIATAGHGKAEFITTEEKLDAKIIRQFERINTAGIVTPEIDFNGNDIAEHLASEKCIFNGDYYQLILKGKSLKKDLKLNCKNTERQQTFVLPIGCIKATQIPLDKFYAKEKIEYIQKLIDNTDGDTKGYEEEIIEIAVQYQINSKYTSFLAVNEREQKILDVPQVEQTKLEQPDRWNASLGQICCASYDVSMLGIQQSIDMSQARRRVSAPRFFRRFKDFADRDETPKEEAPKESLFDKVVEYIVRPENVNHTIIISEIEKQFSLGYGKALEIMLMLEKLEYVTNEQIPTPRIVLVIKNDKGQIISRNNEEIYQDFAKFVIKHQLFDFSKLAYGFYMDLKKVKSMIKRMEAEGLIETYLDFKTNDVLFYRVKKQEKKK